MQDQLLLELLPPPAPAFDNFVAGGNAEVLHALRALADGSSGERIVFLWGASGSGRSHLLQACVAAARARGRDAAYCRGSDAPAAWPAPGALLALDELEQCDAAAQAALFTRLVTTREGDGAVVAAGDVAPAGLTLREDVRTRLGSGWVFQVHPLRDDEKVAALAARAAERGFELPPDAARHLLTRCPRDLPNLLAWLDRLDRSSLERQRPVSVRLLKELLDGARPRQGMPDGA
ncbi:MAG: DnaA regulatory inactivator Hda [Pseudomonadota bacterium]